MLGALLQAFLIVGLVVWGMVGVFRTGKAKFRQFEARWDTNPYGFIIMMAIYVIALLMAAVIFVRIAAVYFP